MFTRAIVRTPCRAMASETDNENPGTPDYEKALLQHADYVEALEECGLDVSVLPADEDFPDSSLVGDSAILTPRCAILMRLGDATQSIETRLVQITISKIYGSAERIFPGQLDAGDVMMAGDHYYIALSERTDPLGAGSMIEILQRYEMSGSIITTDSGVDLKTGLSYLDDNKLLAGAGYQGVPELQHFNVLKVEPQEAYAAKSIWINGTVLVPAGFPETASMIESAGYKVRLVDVSEFRKLGGGVGSLSLRI